MALNGQNSHFFYMDPMLPCLTSIQLSVMRLFFKIEEVQVNLLPQKSKNGHFSAKNGQKMALNGQSSYFFLHGFYVVMLNKYQVNCDALIF